MKTLYLRNVPDDVVDRLERLAEREHLSVSAVAIRELAQSSRRVDAPALFGELPDLGIDVGILMDDIDAGRDGR
jgi:predicted transcriptional regulator